MAEIATVVERVANFAVDSLVQETCFLLGVDEQVKDMQGDLNLLKAFLKDADIKWKKGDDKVKEWLRQLRDEAFEAENVLEYFSYITKRNKMKKGLSGLLSRYACKPCYLKKLHYVGVNIKRINKHLIGINGKKSTYGINEMRDKIPEPDTRRKVCPDSEDDVDVIGFDYDRNQIVEKLVNPKNQLLTIVSIVGMGGIGKSTLAREVYNDPQVKKYFNNVVAWVVVSQKYEVHHQLKEIKKQIMRNESTSSEDREMNEEVTRTTLRNFLKEKRYLIVLDDMWETTAWDQLQGESIRVFPEAKNGSRIVLTTRKLEVAEHPDQKKEIHVLEPLDVENSWKLLRSKAFPSYEDVSDSTENQLEDLGRKLAEKCEGLPLALVILGGYLSVSRNRNHQRWSDLVASLDWEVTDKGKKLEGVLTLSYRDLPQHYLRACFLYIASFPEDYTIPASTLFQLWIAEGFVPHKQGYQLEETARGILEELAQRCMVQVARTRSTTGHEWIDSIRIHDVLRDWAISEGRIDGFVNVWSNNQDVKASDSNAMPAYRVSLMNSFFQDQFSAATPNLRTLSEGWSDDQDVEASGSNAMPSYRVSLMNSFFQDQFSAATPNLRTLLAFGLSPNLVSQIGRLRFLRVLLLEGLVSKEIKFPKEMKGMIHLRYLGLSGFRSVELPSSMWRHLLNLQTLDARGSIIRWLPSSFWDIRTLRNVYLDNVAYCISPKPNCQRSLQTLHISDVIALSYSPYGIQNMTVDFPKVPFGRKFDTEATIRSLVGTTSLFSLTLVIKLGRNGPIPSEALSGFVKLHQLSLIGQLDKLPDVSLLPQNLRELKLLSSELKEDPMPILEKHPSLVLLQLSHYAYRGSSMRCSSGGFRCLQRLTLGELRSVTEWTVEEGAMPNLTHLDLYNSPNLKMFPEEGLQSLMSLKQLTLMDSLSTGNFKKLEDKGCKVVIIPE